MKRLIPDFESFNRQVPWRMLILLASLATVWSRCAAVAPGELSPLSQGEALVGADYYPEHWPEDRWEVDLRLMHEAGFNVVRLAEFSWVFMEPSEGQYDFAWLDRVLALCQKYQIKAILGTPSAVMPAWLAQKYPEALAMKADGTRVVWGGRRHNCFSDPDYRRLALEIATKMAEHYGHHPAVAGWQIDNELGGTDCRCDKCRAAFHMWLREKYGTLEELNRAWGMRFWGLLVSDWDQIPIPDDRVGTWAISNPSASLDWQRFTSHLNVEFLNAQTKILRDRCAASQFVTHNFMGMYAGVDYYDLAKQLDFVSWDNYPELAPALPYDSALAADVMRGLKGKNFLIMEQTAGPLGWAVYSRDPEPGELRSLCYQQLMHGADGQIWFNWRTAVIGREQYWHGILGHDGKPGRRYLEAAQVAEEYRKLRPFFAGTTVAADVALVYDFDSIWAMQIQSGYPGGSPQEAAKRYYRALRRAGVDVDVIPPTGDFSRYKLVVAPHLHVLPDAVAKKLADYVEGGGVLLTDCRTGVKDATNLAYDRTLPGLLAPALGIEIAEYESLRLGISDDEETSYPLRAPGLGDGSFTAIKQADWIKASTAETVATYDEPHLASYAAATRNKFGKGVGWYVGTIVKQERFYDALIAKVLGDAAVRPVATLPVGVEASVRAGEGRRLLFLVNHTTSPQTATVPAGARDLLTDQTAGDHLELAPFGVAVLDLSPRNKTPATNEAK